MRSIIGLVSLLLLSFGSWGQDIALDADFGSAADAITAPATGKGEIKGMLPAGWMENSSAWCEIYAQCTPMEESGSRFLRMNVSDIRSGAAQFCTHIGTIPEKGFIKFTIRYRGTIDGLTTGIRLVDAPYSFLKKIDIESSADWIERTIVFKVNRTDDKTGVWLTFSAPGVVDIARITIERLSEAGMIEKSRVAYPDGGPANLLKNPVLPSGLQTGMLFDRDLSDDMVDIAPDPDVIGPSGCPALRVRSLAPGKGIGIRGETYKPVNLAVRHGFSVRCKGPGTISLQLFRDAQWIATRDFGKAGDDWRTVTLEYQPGFGEFEKPKIFCKGDVWIDAMEAGPLSKAGTFALSGKAVVGLSIPGSDASLSKIQFEDEKALVDVKVFGDSSGAVLKATATDLYGTETALPTGPLTGSGTLKQSRIDFSAALTKRPYGGFRIEVWVDQNGKPVSPVQEIIVYRLRRPLYWGKDAPDSPFGVHTLSTLRHIRMAKAVGANWTRLHDAGLEYIGWWNLEPEKGQWRFFDQEINRFRENKVMIYGELSTAPKWATYYMDTGLTTFGYWDKFFQPKDLADFGNYVKVVVSRYKGVIDHWDIWNEPWNVEWWGVAFDKNDTKKSHGYRTSKEPARDFALLSKAAFTAAKAANPNAYVNGFNSTAGGSGSKWTKGVLEAGGLEYCDGVCYHEYQTRPLPGESNDTIKRGIEDATGAIVAANGKLDKPLWMSEGSCYTSDTSQMRLDFGLYKNSLPFTNNDRYIDAADTLCKYMLALKSYGVKRWFLYSMHCFNGDINACSILVMPDGQLHPAGVAHAAFADLIEGREYRKTIPLAEKTYAFLFEGRGKTVAVISGNKGCAARTFRVPAHAKAVDIYGNAVLDRIAFDGKVSYLVFDSSSAAESAMGSLIK
ncbi:MAG: hypothetical protein HZC28_04150 [Spirochaetes bacterium]|nr:hypothetical protein [Spirochaetota bacterium]